MSDVTPLSKPKREDDGAFSSKNPPSKECIMCGIYYPGHIERHHGKSKASGGNHTELNKFDLCVGPPNDCHGRAQRYEKGYTLPDLERAKERQVERMRFYSSLFS